VIKTDQPSVPGKPRQDPVFPTVDLFPHCAKIRIGNGTKTTTNK